jgi:hypothetical protein
MRNYLMIYDFVVASWWSFDIRFVRKLKIWCLADYVGLTVRSTGRAAVCWTLALLAV